MRVRGILEHVQDCPTLVPTNAPSQRPAIAVLVVSPHSVTQRGLSSMIAEIVSGAAIVTTSDTRSLFADAGPTPDLVVFDAHPAAIQPSTVSTFARARTPVIALTEPSDVGAARACLAAGVEGCLGSNADEQTFRVAVSAVLCGQRYIDPHLVVALARTYSYPGGTTTSLTPRERQILGLLAQGCSNRTIAKQLHIAEKTVKGHVTNIFAKLNVQSRLAAALLAPALL